MSAEPSSTSTTGGTAGTLTVLSGPAGVGKSTVVAWLREHAPELWHSVSVTTRAPRPGEVDGASYHFVSERRFRELVEAGELLEHARYAGNGYGTPRAPVEERLASGTPALLEIDVEGARQVRRARPETRLVFLAPPSWRELERRLRGRGTEDADVVARRLARATEELAAEPEFDVTVVADSVAVAAQAVLREATRW